MSQSDKDEWAARLALLQEQRERFEAGMEIEPPWVVTPEWEPRHRDCSSNEFAEGIWRPYIRSMTNEQRAAYFAKWPLPEGQWYPAVRDYLAGVDDPAWRITY